MKKEIAEEWVKALRSGRYKQGRGKLKSVDDQFCCLGVLCDIAPSSVGVWSGIFFINEAAEESSSVHLIYSVYTWASITNFNGMVSSLRISLISLNDSHGYNFNQIADFIEQNWESL